jgi:hypothetical protein
MMNLSLLFLFLCVPPLDDKDPTIEKKDNKSNVYLHINPKGDDFITNFVRETLIIPDDELTGKYKPKYAKYLREWLLLRRKLNAQVVDDLSITRPMISYSRNERPVVLAYPYASLPDSTIFLRHLIYLDNLSKLNDPGQIVRDSYVTLTFHTVERSSLGMPHSVEVKKYSIGRETIAFDPSPLIDFKDFYYVRIDNNLVFSEGPTVREQFHALDCNTGLLLNNEEPKDQP